MLGLFIAYLMLYLVNSQFQNRSSTENATCLENGDIVIFVEERRSFFFADLFCKNDFDSKGQLAPVFNSKELFIIANLTLNEDAYIGIRADFRRGQGNSENFFFLNDESQEALNFIHVGSGEFPWSNFNGNSEPNNDDDSGEDCVVLS